MSLLFLSWWGGLHSHHQSSQHLHLHLSCCHLNLMVVLECSAAFHGCAASCTQGLFCMPLEAECANLVIGISISVWWHLCIAQQWSALSCAQSCIASALGWWHEAGESSAMCAAYTHCHPLTQDNAMMRWLRSLKCFKQGWLSEDLGIMHISRPLCNHIVIGHNQISIAHHLKKRMAGVQKGSVILYKIIKLKMALNYLNCTSNMYKIYHPTSKFYYQPICTQTVKGTLVLVALNKYIIMKSLSKWKIIMKSLSKRKVINQCWVM